QHVPLFHQVALSNIHLLHNTFKFASQVGGSGRDYNSCTVHSQREWEGYYEENCCSRRAYEHGAAMFLESKESPFFGNDWLQHSDERNFFVKRSIPQCYSRLASQDLDHLQVSFQQKIGIAAFKREDTDAPFFVSKRQYVKSTHASLGEIITELCPCLFTVSVDLVSVLGD